MEGRIHFRMDVHFQLHNTGLGFCADCQAEGDLLGCAMMLAPCSDSRRQQVSGQSSQGSDQGRPISGLSQGPLTSLWGISFQWSISLDGSQSPTVMTQPSPAYPTRSCKHRHGPSSENARI